MPGRQGYSAAMPSKPVPAASRTGALARPPQPAPRATVLLTGFAPFDGDARNSSWEAARGLHDSMIAGHHIVAAQLPTVFETAPQRLLTLLRRHDPALVVCAGQASERQAISLERVAINLVDARIPDNAGAQPLDLPAVRDGPPAYFSTLPVKAMLRDLQAAGLPAEVSHTAGTFVCNHVFYHLMHVLQRQPGLRCARGGFIHLPALEQPDRPSMTLSTMRQGLRIAIACALAMPASG